MSELSQFNQSDVNTLTDFQDDSQIAPPVTSASSNQNMAAHAAILAPHPDQVAGVYNTAKDEYDTLGYSPTVEEVVGNAKGVNAQAYRRASVDFLMDPSVTDEWKQNALTKINDETSELYRVRAMVGTQEASKINPNETEEATSLRGVWAAGINRVLDFQREKQKFYNEMQLRQDANKAATYVGSAEDFIPTVSGYKTSSLVSDLTSSGSLSTLWGTLLPGESKEKLVSSFNQIPFEERQLVMQKAMDVIAKHGSTIVLPEEMDQANMSIFRDMVEAGDYTLTDRVVDNVLGVLDVTGVLGAIKMVGKAAKGATEAVRAEEAVTAASSNFQRQFTITDVQPASPSQVIKDANPEMARRLHDTVEKDIQGDVANGAYGTSREDAIAHDISPQVASVDGSVVSKVSHPEKIGDFERMPDANVIDWYTNSSGYSHLTLAEKRALDANVTNDFMNAFGMTARKEMSSISAEGGPLQIKAVYGPSDSGWSNLQDAVDKARYALRDYAITNDDIDILVRRGDDYVALDKAAKDSLIAGNNVEMKGDYLLQVNHKYNYDFLDLEAPQFSSLDVKWNYADRLMKAPGSSGEGSLTTNLFTMDSLYHPDLVKGAVVSGTRSARLEKLMHDAAGTYLKDMDVLSAKRIRAMDDKIRELNAKGQPFNYTDLRAEGFNEREIGMLEDWKRIQDTNWWLNNQAVVRNYEKRGYGLLEIKGSGFKKAVKDLPANQVAEGTKAYDPVADTIRTLSKDDVKRLYDEGKTVARAAHSSEIDGTRVLHVINPNSANDGYIRAFTKDDVMLNYRNGYYAVRYKDPHFIERKVVDDEGKPVLNQYGKERWEAIATAGDAVTADKAIARMKETKPGEYRRRNDYRGEERNRAEGQTMLSGGMSAERLRGKRLENANADGVGMEHQHIQSPSDSLQQSIRAISDRIAYQDWSDTAKARFMAQYGEVLPTVKGQQKYPRTVDEIEGNSKMAADARTTWEYIRAMDNGYTNQVDNLYKGVANGAASALGESGFGALERAVRTASDWSPTTTAKSLVYNLYLVAAPLRQLVMQSAQSIMLFSIKPMEGMRMVDDLILYSLYHARNGQISNQVLKMYGRDDKFLQMIADFKKSGMADAVEHNEFIDSMKNLTAETSRARMGIARTVGRAIIQKPFGVMRKYGFDLGEHVSQFMAFKSFYMEKASKGVKMSPAEVESVIHEARNFTGNFDRKAGVMPYTRASAAMFTQFLNVPHKFISLVTTNRLLNKKQKVQMAASMSLMFGVGTEEIYRVFSDDLPENPQLREMVTEGLVSAFINNSIQALFGEDGNLDIKENINPIDPQGVLDMATALFEGGIGKMISESPSGSLFFGTNPRVTNFIKTMASVMGLGGEADKALPVRFSNITQDVGNMFSGLSHAYKAAHILQYGQKINAYGGVIQDNMNTVQGIAQAFGFITQDERNMYELMKKASDLKKTREEDIKQIYKEFSRRATQQGMTKDQLQYTVQVFNAAMSIYKSDPEAQKLFINEMRKGMADGDNRVFETLRRMSGWADNDEVRELLDKAPLDPEKKANLKSYINLNAETLEKSKKENK